MEHFKEEGRLGVAAFALFNLSAIGFNLAVYEAPVAGPLTVQIIAMVTMQAGAFFSRRTKWIAGFTICYWLLHLYVMRRVIVPEFSA